MYEWYVPQCSEHGKPATECGAQVVRLNRYDGFPVYEHPRDGVNPIYLLLIGIVVALIVVALIFLT